MATNFVQPGDSVTVVAAANAVSGAIVVQGQMFGVAAYDALTGEQIVLTMGGVWDFAKANAASTSMAAGANAFWDNTNSIISVSTGTRVGMVMAAVGNNATTVRVRLNSSF